MKMSFTLLFLFYFIIPSLVTASEPRDFEAVSLHYLVYNPESGTFDRMIEAQDGYEVLFGDKYYGAVKPVCIFKNTSNKPLAFGNAQLITSTSDVDISSIIHLPVLLPEQTRVYRDLNYSKDNEIQNAEGIVPPGGSIIQIFPLVYPDKAGYTKLIVIPDFLDKSANNTKDLQSMTLRSGISAISFIYSDTPNHTIFGIDKNQGYQLVDSWNGNGIDTVLAEQYAYQSHQSMSAIWNPADSTFELYKRNPYVLMLNGTGKNHMRYTNGITGDRLVSHVVDLRYLNGTRLELNYQRAEIFNNGDFNRGSMDTWLHGPETRVVSYGNTDNIIREPDELIVEFISADRDNLHKLLNVPDDQWNIHPRHGGAVPVTDNPPLTIFGGGGYRVGFLEKDIDSALTREQGLRADIYDAGHDNCFKKAFVPIPDTFITKGGFFRFRIRVNSIDHSSIEKNVYDDEDNFLIESFSLNSPCECSEMSLVAIKVHNKYSMIPPDCNIDIPLSVIISNNLYSTAPAITLKTFIKHPAMEKWVNLSDTLIGGIHANEVREIFLRDIRMKDFKDYLHKGSNRFTIISYIQIPGGDENWTNDTIIDDFIINVGTSIAFDNPIEENDLAHFANTRRGLNLSAYSEGDDSFDHSFGPTSGNKSGQLAIKFELSQTDSIFGFQAYWAWLNSAPDNIDLSIYKDNNGLPGERVSNTLIEKMRGYDDILSPVSQELFWDRYVTYLYNKPIILPAGKYWASIAQKNTNGFHLGGSGYRCAMTTTVCSMQDSGKSNTSVMIFDGFRKPSIEKGDPWSTTNTDLSLKYINESNFAYENGYGSGNWVSFTPQTGHPAYAHKDFMGNAKANDTIYSTYQRGTFIPMLRVYMGKTPKVASYPIDIALKSIDVPQVVYPGQGIEIRCKAQNRSSSIIYRALLGYRIENEPELYVSFPYTDFPEFSSYSFLTNDYYMVPNEYTNRKIKIKIWVITVNGQPDSNPLNDTLTAEIQVGFGNKAERNILIEQITSALCDVCPQGQLKIDSLLDQKSNIIVINHHAGIGSGGNDAMTVPGLLDIATELNNYAPPAASIDRVLLKNNIRTALNIDDWDKAIKLRELVTTPLKIDLSHSFNPETRQLDITTGTEFLDYDVNGDYRLHVFIIADSVTGIGSGYDQANFYNYEPGHPLYQMGDPIKNYVHRYVLVSSLSGTQGISDLFTSDPVSGLKAQKSFTYTIPESMNPDQVMAVAFVTRQNEKGKEVVNSVKSGKITTDIPSDSYLYPAKVYVLPNPANNDAVLYYNMDMPGKVVIKLYNSIGREIACFINESDGPGSHNAKLNLNDYPNGVYFYSLQINGKMLHGSFTIVH